MREFTEKEKENKNKSEKIKEKISKNTTTNLEDEFQPDSRIEEKDEIENDFIPFDEDPNSTDIIDNKFEPIDNDESKIKAEFNIHPDENRRILEEKQAEDVDKKYIKKKYDNKGKPFEIPTFTSKENSKLAEMIGIILGDGNTYYDKGKKYLLRISSNRVEEKKYRNYTKKLMEDLFKISPKSYDKSDRKGTDLTLYNKSVVEGLIEKGIIPGNKVKNQIKVPKWIKKTEINKIGCLRGLFDTDGSVYLRNTQKSFGLNFKNGSFPLVKDFKAICESEGINTQKIPEPKIYKNPDTKEIFKTYQVTIENKSEISKFLYKIKPKKWDFHAKIIGMSLLTLEDPLKRAKIKKELDKKYPDKKIHYSTKFENLLKNLCEKHGYNVNKRNIINAIEKALSDKRKKTEKLNFQGRELIKELNEKIQ